MCRSHAWFLAVVFGTTCWGHSALAELDLSHLPDRPVQTLASALGKAKQGPKAVFLILYDDRETPADSLAYFFDAESVKKAFEEHFVLCVRDRTRPDVEKYAETDDEFSWNRPKFVLVSPTGDLIYHGRILKNDEVGRREIGVAIERWLPHKQKLKEQTPQTR